MPLVHRDHDGGLRLVAVEGDLRRVDHRVQKTLGGVEPADAVHARIDIRLHEGERRFRVGKTLPRRAGDVVLQRGGRQSRRALEFDVGQNGERPFRDVQLQRVRALDFEIDRHLGVALVPVEIAQEKGRVIGVGRRQALLVDLQDLVRDGGAELVRD